MSMLTATIDGTEVKLAEVYTVDQWCELQRFDFENEEEWPAILECVTGVSSDIIRRAKKEPLELLVSVVIVTMNQREYIELPDFNAINFGEFVDLDCFVALGIEKNLSNMLGVLKADTVRASQALLIIENYVKWRTTIYRKYASLFGLRDKDFERYSDNTPDDTDPLDVARGWYRIIVDLAGDDILKIDPVTEQPLEKTLTFLNLKKEKALKEAEEARKMRNKKR